MLTRTIRFRLSVWYSSLLLVFGVAFVVALNITARGNQPTVYQLDNIAWEPVRNGPGGAVNVVPQLTMSQVEDAFYTENLERLQSLSLIAVVGLALASGIGGYMLSGMLLRPIRDITEVASGIGASNLGKRINHQGPDDELKALADTFDSMIARIEESFENQRQFVQDASHELRTPLAALRTNIEVAEMDASVSPEEFHELMTTLKTQTERLTRLSDDLLLLTTSEGVVPEPEPVNLDAIAEEVVRQLGPVASTKDITLRIEGQQDIEAEANGDLLYRSVFNLVDNAIKYSTPGSRVIVRTAESDKYVQIEVIDNGPGISADEVGRVFDRFYRVDKGRSRRQGGAGLGLAIVKELMHSMNGTVSASSVEGQGATFTLTLPKPAPTTARPVPSRDLIGAH